MRRITRTALPALTQQALNRRQRKVDRLRANGILNVDKTWRSARRARDLKSALDVLRTMAGKRERCMYCGDSHGSDIEHFWPKASYPDRMFQWPNLLLCCTECGRFKGPEFPLENGIPLLVDPSDDDPWAFIDFDPTTGNLVARFDTASNSWSIRGTKTVEILQLDRREALAVGYQKTYRRLVHLTEHALDAQQLEAAVLITNLREADDHGLLGWIVRGTGQNVAPFSGLRTRHPDAWLMCAQAFV